MTEELSMNFKTFLEEYLPQDCEKACEAAQMVGYESFSQFNREYKRLFGTTHVKDRPNTLPTIL